MAHGERVGGGAAERRRLKTPSLMMRAAMEHHSRQIKATVGVQIVAVPAFFQLSEEGSDGVQDGEAVGLDVRVVPLERVSERSAVSGLQRHSPNIEHAPSLDVPTLQVCRDGGPGGGLQDFLPVQGSEAVFGGGGPGGRPRGLVPGQSSTASSCGATPVEQVTDVPFGMSQDSIPQRAVLRAPQVAEQLVEVPVLVPFFNDWFRWEEAYRATGHRWLGGFERSLFPYRESTASPGRFSNTGQGSRRRHWYRTAAVPAVQAEQAVLRPRGGHSRFRLVRTVQTLQRIGGASYFGRCACAMPGSTADTCSARLGGFIEVFST